LRQQLDLDEASIDRVTACMEMFRVKDSSLPPACHFPSLEARDTFVKSNLRLLARWLDRIAELDRARWTLMETCNRPYRSAEAVPICPAYSAMFWAKFALDQRRDLLGDINKEWITTLNLNHGLKHQYFYDLYVQEQVRWKEARRDFERMFMT
jgi:hypothetical protein